MQTTIDYILMPNEKKIINDVFESSREKQGGDEEDTPNPINRNSYQEL